MKRLLLAICVLSMGSLTWAQSAPSLGSSASFAVLGTTTVTNATTPPGPPAFTTITGDLGLSPPGVSVTGFSLAPGVNRIVVGPPPATGVTDGPGIVTGTMHVADAAALLAHADATKAYAALLAEICNPTNNLSGVDLGGLTLAPGVYCFDSSAQLTGILTLSGNGVYVFKIGSTLTTATGSSVVLTNGALCGNVFWQVGSSATLGTGTIFVGTVIAFTSDTVTTGVSVAGRVFALGGAVTLDTNIITVGACAAGGGGGGGGDNDACHDDRDKDRHDKDDKDKDRHDKDKDHRDDD
jgi:Ice-binding-like